jgi:hypothetical protein
MLNIKTSFVAILATISMLAAKTSGLPLSTTTSDTSPRDLDILERATIHVRDTCYPIQATINFCTISISTRTVSQFISVADKDCNFIAHAFTTSKFDLNIKGLAHHVTGDPTIRGHPSFCFGNACRGNNDACWRVEENTEVEGEFFHSCTFAC